MPSLILLVIIALVVYVIFLSVTAKQQVNVESASGKLAVQEVIDEVFGSVLWSRCAGPGHINLNPRLRAHAPTISIDVEPREGGGSEVQIWMSAWKSRYGLVTHGQLVWRKKRQLATRLQGGTAAMRGVVPHAPPSPSQLGGSQAPPAPPPASRHAAPRPAQTSRADPTSRSVPTSRRASRPPAGSSPSSPAATTAEQRLALRLLVESPLTVVVKSPGDLRALVNSVRGAVATMAPASATHFVLGPPRSTMWAHAVALPQGGCMLIASLVGAGAPDIDYFRNNIERPLRMAIESQPGGELGLYPDERQNAALQAAICAGRVVAPAELLAPG